MCKKCSICNSDIKLEQYQDCNIKNIMKEKNMCFNCAFWQEKIDITNKDTLVIEGNRYQGNLINKDNRSTFGLGMGGRDTYVMMLNNSNDIRHYNNVWCQGTIPELWKSKIPNNAKFISEKEYFALLENNKNKNKYLLIYCANTDKENYLITSQYWIRKRKIKKNSIETFEKFVEENRNRYDVITAISPNENLNIEDKILTYHWSRIICHTIINKRVWNKIPKFLWVKAVDFYKTK